MSGNLEVRGVSKSYGSVKAVIDVSFSVAPGEIVVLLGDNGAGKSTILRSIVGLQGIDAGSILVDGRDVSHDPIGARAALGFLPEETVLYPDLTGRETLQMAGALRQLDGDRVERRADALLSFFKLEGAADRPVKGYSKGMRRKVALSVALLGEPPVLVLDEPTGGLDPVNIALFRSVLREARDRRKAILLSSHLLAEVENDADRLAIMKGGALLAIGDHAELRKTAGLPEDAPLEQVYLSITGHQLGSAAGAFEGGEAPAAAEVEPPAEE